MGVNLEELSSEPIMHFAKICSGILSLLSLANAQTWVDICADSSGNHCCAADGSGMGDATNGHHKYWIMKDQASAQNLDLLCRTEAPGASKLAVFESKRENDCVAKYIMDEFEDATAKQYVIGLKVDQEFPGIYEWHRVDTSANPDAASLAFSNWTPTSPTGLACVAMTVGADDPQNGRWTDVDCNSVTMYGICEKDS